MTITTSRPAIVSAESNGPPPGGTQLRQAEVHATPAGSSPAGSAPRPTGTTPTSNEEASGGVQHASGHEARAAHRRHAAGAQPADRHPARDSHGRCAVGSTSGPDPVAPEDATPECGSLLDPALALAADVLDDIERVRTANDALRVVSKEILKDLWRAARDWHLAQGGEP